MAHVLGISIGTRNVGIAIIRLRKLTDYRIRTFPGKWNEEKCEAIWDVVESIIKQDSITDIIIKVPPLSHCSPNLEYLTRGIEELGKWFEVDVHRCSIQDLKLPYRGTVKGNKQTMITALIEKYPELAKEWTHGKHSQAYNAKLFEAIACAELALRGGH